MSGGWNPMTGHDSTGTRPMGPPSGAPIASQGQPYIPYVGGPGYNFNAVAPQYQYTYPQYGSGVPVPAYGQFTPAYPNMPAAPGVGTGGFTTTRTFSHQPNGTGNILPRHPQPHPAIDASMPAAQMTNSSGGVGCEPGYNYFFPAEHTKVHVFKSDTPPWQLPANAQIPFIASHVPTATTLGDLLKGFGCYNPVPKKNRCVEIVSGGNGKWYKGFSYGGDEKDRLKMTMKDAGWDGSRTGNPDGKPVVCLWFCKN